MLISYQVVICGCPLDRGNCTMESITNDISNPLILMCNCMKGK